MSNDDIYEKIRLSMNKGWPLKLPKEKSVLDILKIIYAEEEDAKIVSVFDQAMFDLKSPKKIAKITGIPLEKVIERCEAMVRRGVILKMGKKYGIFAAMPGLIEFYFIANENEEEMKMGAKLLDESFGKIAPEWFASGYPFFRNLPSSSLKEKTIEIDEKIEDVGQKFLVYEDIEAYINRCTNITVVNCACRTISDLLGDKCEKMTEDVCMALNMAGDSLEPYGLGRKVSKEEALEIVKKCEDSGLIHTINNASGPDAPMMICNCCPCHCEVIKALKKFQNPSALARSNFKPVFNQENCVLCNKCIQICPMDALWHHYSHTGKNAEERVMFKENFCIGCGLCAHHCPKDAIKMIKAYNDIPEETILGMFQRVEETRGH
ncbi:MAG: 4Fe-4S dicluster domain-containing protein [Candidatus Lokiarchaeota archaeon]|nr:4Fe-4S dicluster domain-containing protein [Candidatus Lokiarchaeota archaeon]